jgi:hypothetical protein
MKQILILLTVHMLTALNALSGDRLDSRDFANPPPDNMPAMLWFWKDTFMTEALIEKQLDLMKEKGIMRVSISTRGSGHQAYGKEWLDLMDKTLQAAKKRGMKIWLYNEYRMGIGKMVVEGGEAMGKTFEPRPDLLSSMLRHAVLEVKGGRVADLSRLLPEVSRPNPSSIGIKNGALALSGVDACLLNAEGDITDGRISFDLKPTARKESMRNYGKDLGWVLRAQNETSGYFLFLQTESDKFPMTILNCLGIRDGKTILRKSWPIEIGIQNNTAYRIENVLSGNKIAIFINGKKIADFEDDTFPKGRFGLWSSTQISMSIDNLEISRPDGKTLVYDFASPGSENSFGKDFDRDNLVAVAAIPLGGGLADVKDLTEAVAGKREWDFGNTPWLIHFFTKQTYHKRLGDSLGDVLNPEVGELYSDILYGGIKRRFGWAMEEGILEAVKDDEPVNSAWPGNIPWSVGIEKRMRAHGNKPAEILPALFADYGREGKVRNGLFWRCYNEAWSEGWYAPQGKWCADHGISLLSNPPGDNSGPGYFNAGGNYQLNNQHVQIPGHDNVFAELVPGKRSLMPRYGVSSANIFGRKWTFMETFGGYGWWVSPEIYKYAIGSMAVRGENMFELHGFWSNYPTTPEQIPFPPTFDPDSTWWPVLDRMVIWAGRVSLLNTGRAVKQTALLIPQRAAECSRKTATYAPQTAPIDAAFEEAVYALEDAQVDFDLVSESFFDNDAAMGVKAKVENGKLIIGNGIYSRLIVAGAETMSLETFKVVSEFMRQGGTVAWVGANPKEETLGRDGELNVEMESVSKTTGKGKLLRCAKSIDLTLLARQQKWMTAEFEGASNEIRVLHRRFANADAYLVFNESEKVYDGIGGFPSKGAPELWDVDSGRAFAGEAVAVKDGNTGVKLHLEPYQFMAVVFKTDGSVGSLVKWKDDSLRQMAAAPISLHEGWIFKFDKPGNESKPIELGDWTAMDPKFSGTGVYACEFTLPGGNPAGKQWLLDLGAVKEFAEVEINGQKAGWLLWRPYRLDIGNYLKPGINKLVVRVTNTRANSRGDSRISGLFGPVELNAVTEE